MALAGLVPVVVATPATISAVRLRRINSRLAAGPAITLGISDPISIDPTGQSTPTADQKRNVRVGRERRYARVGDQAVSAFSVLDLGARRLPVATRAASGTDIFTALGSGPAAGRAITTARYGGYLDVVSPSPPTLLVTIRTTPPDTRGEGLTLVTPAR